MRVVMIVRGWPANPDWPKGGVEAAASCLVRALVRVQPELDLHVVHCPTPQDGVRYQEGQPPYTVHRLGGHTNWLCLIPGFTPRRRIERLLAELKPDVVHVQAASLFIDARQHPAVLTIHGIGEFHELYRDVRFPRLRSFVRRIIMPRTRARYRHVVTIAGYVAQYRRGGVVGRSHFIPNPIEPAFFENRRQESGPRIVYAGSVMRRKNMHGLLAALGILGREGADFTLRVAGSHPTGSYAERIDALLEHHDLRQRVTFLGNLNRPDLIEELRQARCLVLPSFQETLPMVVAEAGAMGVPQVVTPAGGTHEMVVNGYSGFLVDAYHPESIADGLRPLLEDADLAAEFGERARDMARIYHPDTVARQTLGVYRIVAEEWKAS